MHTRTTTLLLSLFLTCSALHAQSLSLEEALHAAHSHNLSLAIAQEGVRTARSQSRELNSFWYPTLLLSGEYSHSLTEIAAKSTIGEIGGKLLPALGELTALIPTLQGIVEGISQTSLRLPLVPRNTAEVGVEVAWTIFSGGRRLQASKISKAVVALANERLAATEDAVEAAVIEAYFALQLALRAVEVRKAEVASLAEHLRQARHLECEGMIIPAERVAAEVGYEQSKANLTAAERTLHLAERALGVLMGCDTLRATPTTPLFLPSAPPSRETLLASVGTAPTIGTIELQKQIATHSLTAERSRYLPSIALLGHQQLWSVGLNKNLFPRTFVGVGLSWTLFDGLSREGSIARTKSLISTTESAQRKAVQDIELAIDKFYTSLTNSINEYHIGLHTQELAEELVRCRQRAFAEGMATSSEVVDARLLLTQIELGTAAALYTSDTALANLLMLTGQTEKYVLLIEN